MFRFLTRKLKGEEDAKKDPYAELTDEMKVHAAACNNDVKMLEKLAKELRHESGSNVPGMEHCFRCKDGIDFNVPRPQDGYYALDSCAWSGNVDAIKVLLAHGADPSITLQAVVGAASWGDPEMLEALIDAGGQLDQDIRSISCLNIISLYSLVVHRMEEILNEKALFKS
eukprot:symbB.v1.2.031563.t1/scaffold3637.1/size52925/1